MDKDNAGIFYCTYSMYNIYIGIFIIHICRYIYIYNICSKMEYFSGKNTGVHSCSLFQGIFPTQGPNPGLPPCRRILHHLSDQGSPLLSHQKNEIMSFSAMLMDLEIIILSQVSQKEKNKYHMISLIYGI